MIAGPHVYEAQWQRYRFWKRLLWALLICWLPFGALAMMTFARWRVVEALGWPVLIGYMAAYGVAGVKAGSFRCPRCGNPFFSRRRVLKPWVDRCAHCGLPKWAGSLRRPLTDLT